MKVFVDKTPLEYYIYSMEIKKMISRTTLEKNERGMIVNEERGMSEIEITDESCMGYMLAWWFDLPSKENKEESLCDDCEWFKNPGACPDYNESKCRYNEPIEREDR